MSCFGVPLQEIKQERVYRFLEESIELSQALGCSEEDAVRLVRYVFSRPVGDPAQEVGGVMLTTAALCSAHNLDMEKSAEDELLRVWENIDKIRSKWEKRNSVSPLP